VNAGSVYKAAQLMGALGRIQPVWFVSSFSALCICGIKHATSPEGSNRVWCEGRWHAAWFGQAQLRVKGMRSSVAEGVV
jgi:hypothetical protein